MPRQRTNYIRETYNFLSDFPERLERFQRESGLPWAELIRRLGIDPETMRRWRQGRSLPSARHLMALLNLADDLGLCHIFNGGRRRAPLETRDETTVAGVPHRRRRPSSKLPPGMAADTGRTGTQKGRIHRDPRRNEVPFASRRGFCVFPLTRKFLATRQAKGSGADADRTVTVQS